MPSSPQPAIATLSELNELTAESGVFSIAEQATDDVWIMDQRVRVQAAIARTKSQLKRLDNALLRLEHAVHSMGRDGSAQQIEREYVPLEGWALTLIENYATLVGMLSHNDRRRLLGRLKEYTRGMTIQANGGDASHTLGSVRAFLAVRAFVYGVLSR
jgi:hypothetical protein